MPAAADGDLRARQRHPLLGEYDGKYSPRASGPLRAIIPVKYSRSAAITAVQVRGPACPAPGSGRLGGVSRKSPEPEVTDSGASGSAGRLICDGRDSCDS